MPQAHNEDFHALYKSVPFLMCLKKNGEAYGVFYDNTFRSYINLGKENEEYFFYNAEEGNMDFYFLVGENILVAPVLEQGATKRMVYLPEGTWYDYWTGEKPYNKLELLVTPGAGEITKEMLHEEYPVYEEITSVILER